MTIGVLGGTGPEGRGLAMRLAMAGHDVVVGSRDARRAAEAVRALVEACGERARGRLRGGLNREAAERADLVVVAVPYAGMASTLEALAPLLAGKTCVCTVAPIEVADGRVGLRPLDGSAAEEAARIVPAARWVAALHTVPASALLRCERPLNTDALVASDDAEARTTVVELLERIPGLRGVDVGRLANARHLEAATALLIDVNRIHRAHASLRVLGI